MGKSLVSCFFETQCIYIRQLTRKYLQSSSCFNNAENSAGENWQRRLCVGLAVRSHCFACTLGRFAGDLVGFGCPTCNIMTQT